MVISFGKLMRRLKIALLFLALTAAVFAGYRYLLLWVDQTDKYAPPKGQSLKVFHESADRREQSDFTERLRLFYTIGE